MDEENAQVLRNVAFVREIVDNELDINLEASDVHSAADMAADVVERLIREFHLTGFNRDDSF